MAHWLYKSEPFKWSWTMQKDADAAGTDEGDADEGVRGHGVSPGDGRADTTLCCWVRPAGSAYYVLALGV